MVEWIVNSLAGFTTEVCGNVPSATSEASDDFF
jgi:hypothetical protein